MAFVEAIDPNPHDPEIERCRIQSITYRKRHCCRVSPADKGWRFYPLNPRPDAVGLFSGCIPGKRSAWLLPDDRHTVSLVGLSGGWKHARTKLFFALMDPMQLCPGKFLVLPSLNIEQVATYCQFLILSILNNEMSRKSPFAIQKAIQGIGGEPKSFKKLRSGDLLVETASALQTKSFLLEKTFLNRPLTVSLLKSLTSSRDVISEPDLMCTSETEILERFSGQGVIQPETSDYNKGCLFKLQDPSLYTESSALLQVPESHSSDSKLCQKWKTEKEIQTIKTNRNISYVEARKSVVPQLSQTYAQAAKPSIVTTRIQTDENITKIVCPPLKLLIPLVSLSKPTMSTKTPVAIKSSTTSQANLLPSTSSVTITSSSESQPPIPLIYTVPTTSNSLSTSSLSNKVLSSSKVSMFTPLPAEKCPVIETSTTISKTILPPTQAAKQTSKNRRENVLTEVLPPKKIEIQLTTHKPQKSPF
ncbi:uncharacterized protein TNCV_2331291 [Trichonephila clavipes]|nr:uncharacterized protein TNCV_2331291 [Trichonephila clavipes]